MKIAIIGAGVTGLTAAYEILKTGKDMQVDIFEESSQIGGLVEASFCGGTRLENYYHHIFTNDEYIISLINELKLEDRLIWRSPKNGIYTNDKLFPFTSPLDLLMFKELSIINRIRLGLLVLKASAINDWKALEDITAKEWIIKNSGSEVYEKVWKPLLNSKFGKDADSISAVWIWNKFKLRGSSRKSKISKEMLGYMEGSFEVLYKELAKKITENKGNIFLNKRVTKITNQKENQIKISVGDKNYIYNKLIFTSAPSELNNLMDGEVISDKVSYKANICMTLKTKKSLSDYYWITVAENESPFVLMLEHTNLFDNKEYGSKIIYLSTYLDSGDILFASDDTHIKNKYFTYLKKMFPKFDESNVVDYSISRTKYAQPVVFKKYSEIRPEYKTKYENIYLVCMAQIYPEDRGQNYAVREGKKIAHILKEEQSNEK